MSSEEPLSRTNILPSQLRLTAHTTYYSSFFLLRMQITVNSQPAQVGCSSVGELTLSCRYPSLSLPLHSIRASLEEVVKTSGVSRVGDIHCEEVPLFSVSFSSEYNLRKFLISRETAQQQLESLFPVMFPLHCQQPGSDQLTNVQQPSSNNQQAGDRLLTYVQLQLFLVSPDAVTKDARVVEVTLENHSACMALFKESEMFDYWSLFQAHRIKNKTPCRAPTIKDLVSELHDVVRWFQLGIYLDISPPVLMKIRADHRETEPCKTEMLVMWLRQTREASWSTVVRALVGMRMGSLAQKVAVKYGVAVPSAVERKELQQFPVVKENMSSLQSKLLGHAQQLNQELEVDDEQLSEINHALEQATKCRVSARSKRLQIRQEADDAYVRVKVLLERKKGVEKQLQIRQRELRFLQQFQEQQKEREEERESEELKAVLMSKHAEVSQLQDRLREVQGELGCAREETHSLREELQRVTAELAEKSVEVQQLEWARAMLEIYLDRETKKVEMLLIQCAASSKEALQREIKDQLSSVEEEFNVIAGSEVKAFKQTIAEKDSKISELSDELHTLQSQLQGVSKCQPEEEEEEEEELHRLTIEISEQRAKVVKTEDEKREWERQLEATDRQMESLQQLIAELREKDSAASQSEPQKCTVVGQVVKPAEIGEQAYFEVHLEDMAGDHCTTEQQVIAELRSFEDSSVTPTRVVQKTPEIYEVSYQPTTQGRYSLSVQVNDVPVQGSPFLVYVRQAPHLLGNPVRVIRELHRPYMIAATSSGELVVSERFKISLIHRHGKRIKNIDTTSVRSDNRRYKLNPCGVAVDKDNNIYVTDVESHRLSKFNSDGKLVKSIGGKGNRIGHFDYPHGIALSTDGKLFICDSSNHRIQIFDANLKFISCFGTIGSGEGEMNWPNDLTFDPAGGVYVAESYNHRIQVFSHNGTSLRTFGMRGSGPGELSFPRSIHVDHDYVYVSEWGNHRVSVFHTSGEFITSFGTWGSREGELKYPTGITTNQDGFLYVCDSHNNHIQVF